MERCDIDKPWLWPKVEPRITPNPEWASRGWPDPSLRCLDPPLDDQIWTPNLGHRRQQSIYTLIGGNDTICEQSREDGGHQRVGDTTMSRSRCEECSWYTHSLN
jgi:hypothetical protein